MLTRPPTVIGQNSDQTSNFPGKFSFNLQILSNHIGGRLPMRFQSVGDKIEHTNAKRQLSSVYNALIILSSNNSI